jgi:peptide/nickel transport system permease protein
MTTTAGAVPTTRVEDAAEQSRAPLPAARRAGGRSVWARMARNPLTVVSFAFLVFIHLLVFVGPLAWTISPQQTSALDALLPPAPGHPLGTDDLGRDELSRLLHGGQVTLLVGFAAMVTATVLGLLVGATAAFYSGWTDVLLMRFTDTMTAPSFFLIVTAVLVLGPGPLTLIAVIGATSWMQVARVIYGETLRVKALDFVLAAEAMGARRATILFRHVLPQTIPSVVVSATLGVGFAILTESAVSYLGLGIQPPTPSWGNMLQNAQQYVWTSPALAIFPGAVITLVVLAYNFLGDGLRDAVDPRLRV